MKSTNTNITKSSSISQQNSTVKKSTSSKIDVSVVIPLDQPNVKGVKKTDAKVSDKNQGPAKKGVVKNKSKKKTLKNVLIFDKRITDKLKKIVSTYTEYPELLASIEHDTTKSFIDELNIDSVDFVEIIVDVEEEFNISIQDEEIYELNSFEDLYLAIEKKISKTNIR